MNHNCVAKKVISIATIALLVRLAVIQIAFAGLFAIRSWILLHAESVQSFITNIESFYQSLPARSFLSPVLLSIAYLILFVNSGWLFAPFKIIPLIFCGLFVIKPFAFLDAESLPSTYASILSFYQSLPDYSYLLAICFAAAGIFLVISAGWMLVSVAKSGLVQRRVLGFSITSCVCAFSVLSTVLFLFRSFPVLHLFGKFVAGYAGFILYFLFLATMVFLIFLFK